MNKIHALCEFANSIVFSNVSNVLNVLNEVNEVSVVSVVSASNASSVALRISSAFSKICIIDFVY